MPFTEQDGELRKASDVHDLVAAWSGDASDPIEIREFNGGPTVVEIPVSRDFLSGLQFRSLAVGYFNRLQEERKERDLPAYHIGGDSNADHVDAHQRAQDAAEAAAESFEMA